MLKLTKCIGVKSFVEALINMVCELKITAGSLKNGVRITWRSDILLNSYQKTGYAAYEIYSSCIKKSLTCDVIAT